MYVPELSERHLEVEKKYFFHLLIVTEKEKSSFPMAFASLSPVDLFGEISNICHSIWHFKAWKVLSSNLGQSNFMTAVGEKKSQVLVWGVSMSLPSKLKKSAIWGRDQN